MLGGHCHLAFPPHGDIIGVGSLKSIEKNRMKQDNWEAATSECLLLLFLIEVNSELM